MTGLRRLALGLAAILAVAFVAAGCQQALVCDVSVFSVPVMSTADPLPPDAKQILGAIDFDASKATIGPSDQGTDIQGTEVQLQLKPAAAQRFRDFTAANLEGFVAVTLNGSIVSVPMIHGEIPDGAISLMLPSASGEAEAFSRCITGRSLPEP